VKKCLKSKDIYGSGDNASYILNLSTRQRRVVSFILQLFYPQCPLERRFHEPQCRSENSEKFLPCWVKDTVAQPMASQYTDYTMPAMI
jgi:hypothetical protein